MESLRLVALFFRGKKSKESGHQIGALENSKRNISWGGWAWCRFFVFFWVLGSFFLLPKYNTKIEKNTENDDLYKGISVETGAFLCFWSFCP